MESFFKNRAVVTKHVSIDEPVSTEPAAYALPPLDEQQVNCEEEDATSIPETVLDAEEEGYKVELIKEHDIVTKIRITCACGKQFTLNCQYASAAEAPST